MSSEHHLLFETNNIIVPTRIRCLNFGQEVSFNHSLISIFTLILNDLESHLLFVFMIISFKYLPKCSLAYNGGHLISITYLILSIYLQVAVFIIKIVYKTN
jgi:hypothetical protein